MISFYINIVELNEDSITITEPEDNSYVTIAEVENLIKTEITEL